MSKRRIPNTQASLFVNLRQCRQCNEWKTPESFHKEKKSPDGRRFICKVCVKKYQWELLKNPHPRASGASEYKYCPHCKQTKRRTEFGQRRNGRFSKSYCKPCEYKKTKEYLKRHPGKAESYNHKASLKRSYGITPDQYTALLQLQSGRCAICGDPDPGSKRRFLVVDHNHVTGAVRALLCYRCNSAVGFIRERIWIAAKIIAYLELHS